MGPKLILVADDMELVRNLCKFALEAVGYTVVPAPDGLSAVEKYREHAGAIDLSLIDYRMPGMGGIQVARTIRTIDPNAKIVLMTGDNAEAELPEDLSGYCVLLAKPFTIAGLRRIVGELLNPAGEKSSSAAAGGHQTNPISTV